MKFLVQQLMRYFSVGVLNSLVGVLVIWGSMRAGFGPYASNVIGYAAGLIFAFFLNRAWTFNAQNTGWPIFRYLAAFVIAYSINLSTLTILIHYFPDRIYAAQLVSIGLYSLAFFFLCRHFVFRLSKD